MSSALCDRWKNTHIESISWRALDNLAHSEQFLRSSILFHSDERTTYWNVAIRQYSYKQKDSLHIHKLNLTFIHTTLRWKAFWSRFTKSVKYLGKTFTKVSAHLESLPMILIDGILTPIDTLFIVVPGSTANLFITILFLIRMHIHLQTE